MTRGLSSRGVKCFMGLYDFLYYWSNDARVLNFVVVVVVVVVVFISEAEVGVL